MSTYDPDRVTECVAKTFTVFVSVLQTLRLLLLHSSALSSQGAFYYKLIHSGSLSRTHHYNTHTLKKGNILLIIFLRSNTVDYLITAPRK